MSITEARPFRIPLGLAVAALTAWLAATSGRTAIDGQPSALHQPAASTVRMADPSPLASRPRYLGWFPAGVTAGSPGQEIDLPVAEMEAADAKEIGEPFLAETTAGIKPIAGTETILGPALDADALQGEPTAREYEVTIGAALATNTSHD